MTERTIGASSGMLLVFSWGLVAKVHPLRLGAMSIPLSLLGFLALLTTLPVKWAADFTDGENTGLITCFVASLIAFAGAFFSFRLTGGGFIGFVVAYVASLSIYVAALRIPAGKILGFAVIALALQAAVAMALVSFGMHLIKSAG